MKVSVLVFPGSNCDHDMVYSYASVLGAEVQTIWHTDRDLRNPDLVIVPGGFSYGDYLRTGALAKLSPVMAEVQTFAKKGGKVLGICNGFQILCEAGLLPGVLLQNIGMRFLSRFVHVKADVGVSKFSKKATEDLRLFCPVAHFEGNFFADEETLKRIEGSGQVAFRYCNEDGAVDAECRSCNPNGSVNAIAGVCNDDGNVLGMMPHPERALEDLIAQFAGSSERCFFQATMV